MTVQLTLPKELELRLVAEVNAGKHASLEEAIIERVSRSDDPDLLAMAGMSADSLRRDLDDAWNNRADATEGGKLFDRLAARSAAVRAEGRWNFLLSRQAESALEAVSGSTTSNDHSN